MSSSNERSSIASIEDGQQQEPRGGRSQRRRSLFEDMDALPYSAAIRLMENSFKRILKNQDRAVQGGCRVTHQTLLIRLATRYSSPVTAEFEKALRKFILDGQRADIALRWIAELHRQYTRSKTNAQRLRINTTVINLLNDLFIGGHRNLFRKIQAFPPFLKMFESHSTEGVAKPEMKVGKAVEDSELAIVSNEDADGKKVKVLIDDAQLAD